MLTNAACDSTSTTIAAVIGAESIITGEADPTLRAQTLSTIAYAVAADNASAGAHGAVIAYIGGSASATGIGTASTMPTAHLWASFVAARRTMITLIASAYTLLALAVAPAVEGANLLLAGHARKAGLTQAGPIDAHALASAVL